MQGDFVRSTYLTDDRRMLRDLARDFTRKKVRPMADQLDAQKADFPDELIDEMAALGFFGITVPEDLGGLGLGAVEYCLIAEELTQGWMSVGSLIARGNSAYKSIQGTPEQRRAKTALMMEGKYLFAGALSEPGVGSDLSGVTCTARRVGDEWVITGNKYWCTFADRANVILVLCREELGEGPTGRTVMVAVEKERGAFVEGLVGNPIPKIGYYGWKTYELAFDGVRAPVNAGADEGDGFRDVAFALGLARVHTAARSIGLAQAALDDAIEYAQQRVQFGRPIGDFQAIRFKIATMATELEAARQLMYSVAQALDAGEQCRAEISMVKYFAAEMAERVTSEALQILGGAGYTTLHSVERHWRDARLTKIFEGTSEIQQRIISDVLLGREYRERGG
ncbi:acyl-CoA dehydrogenase family protein [Novosphingobium sp. 9U]|uniref:acyl-CoA dehydrogenase family protein n=1 Tax=Novosphingobium sp. 9U TaxID=2653158 RepID=UPI0012F1A628|nr:acyl-CoA dehydrogenase family protein [Novosphingobium sp. 9U]VWX50274.1 Acyl-CoA dehydrogenase [Novosphingobium sp. 9U]